MTDADYEWRLSMWDYHSLRNYVYDAKQKANAIIKSLDKIRTGESEADVYALRDLVRDLKQYADDAWVKAGEIVYDKENEE